MDDSHIYRDLSDTDIDMVFGDGTKHFCESAALALMIHNEIIFVNCRHWRKDLPEADREQACLFVNVNDVFAWGCADAEELPDAEIEAVYRAWRQHGYEGIARWACLRRGERPQPPVEAAMRKCGAWDEAMEALPANRTDARVKAMLAAALATPQEPRP